MSAEPLEGVKSGHAMRSEWCQITERSADDLTVSAVAGERASVTKLAVPAELLRLAGGALRDDDVDEGRAAEVYRLAEGAAQVLRVLDKEALAAEGLHHPVIAGAINQ